MPEQDAPPGRKMVAVVSRSPFTTKLEVATGPFHSPSVAQTRQVYFSPAFTCSVGDHSFPSRPGRAAH